MATRDGPSSDPCGKESLPSILLIDPFDTGSMPPTTSEFTTWELISQLRWLYGRNISAIIWLNKLKDNNQDIDNIIIEAVINDIMNINIKCKDIIINLIDQKLSKRAIILYLLANIFESILVEMNPSSFVIGIFCKFTRQRIIEILEYILLHANNAVICDFIDEELELDDHFNASQFSRDRDHRKQQQQLEIFNTNVNNHLQRNVEDSDNKPEEQLLFNTTNLGDFIYFKNDNMNEDLNNASMVNINHETSKVDLECESNQMQFSNQTMIQQQQIINPSNNNSTNDNTTTHNKPPFVPRSSIHSGIQQPRHQHNLNNTTLIGMPVSPMLQNNDNNEHNNEDTLFRSNLVRARIGRPLCSKNDQSQQ
jgi:hypothetical protein